MQYYCAYCNRLDKIEPSAGEDATVCNQCGHTLTALTEVAKPVSSAPRRLGLIILIGVTGFLLGILWYSGRDLLNPLKGLVHEGSFLDEAIAFVSLAVGIVKFGLSLLIVSCALFIGTRIAAPRRQVSPVTPGAKRLPEKENTRTGLRIASIFGASVGTILTVLVIGFLIFIAWAILGSFYDWLNRPGKV